MPTAENISKKRDKKSLKKSRKASRKANDMTKSKLREYVESIGIAIIAALIIRAFFIQAFRIPTGSMESTLLVGDFLLVNKFVYGAQVPYTGMRLPSFKEPQPGDVVVFKYPNDPTLDYIKRCIAVAGQTIEIKEKMLYIDDKPFNEPEHVQYIDPAVYDKDFSEPSIHPSGSGFNRDNYGPIVVPEGKLFMMGDNRDNSLDSRYWGFLPRENVVGEALVIYWSWDYNVPFYKIFEKVRWTRLADIIR